MRNIIIRILISGAMFGLIIFLLSPIQSCKKCDDTNNGDTSTRAYKPNIYIYPVENTNLQVKVSFPKGGKIVTSIPEYNNMWNVNVDKAGRIDNKYDYLFYESDQPNKWQYNTGWLIEKEKLTTFFQSNMTAYGFNNKEIKDFNDYWIPKLNTFKYYIIYPQEKPLIDKLVQIDYSIKPKNTLRLFYVLKGTNNIASIETHKINSNFKREGFYVTEWGVLFK